MQAGASSEILTSTHFCLANDTSRPVQDRLQSIRKLIELCATTEAITVADAMATDATLDIQDRVNALGILSKIEGANQKAISGYEKIMETLNNSPSIKGYEKLSYLFEIGIGLHTAGSVDKGLTILLNSFKALTRGIDARDLISISTISAVAATEISFNAGILGDRATAIALLRWAVYTPLSGAFLQEAIILGAEVAERMRELTLSREFLEHFKKFGKEVERFKDRAEALEAKLLAGTAS
jgi:hypothetical protein